ncbi:hypothetical protein BsWGS_20765 [Bradybaena similaris]
MGDFSSGSGVLNRSSIINEEVTSLSQLDFNETAGETNATNVTSSLSANQTVLDNVNVVCYIIICVLGLTGNSLVVYVVLMQAKMKTVTNMYILNLALSDILFLIMLPITVTTVIVKHWVFGLVMCKIYFVLYAFNIFGVVFNLCVMSADRYLAVCHPIRALKYRTPRIALSICLCVWALCCVTMTPFILYATTVEQKDKNGRVSCRVEWPNSHIIFPGSGFVWYSFILGFLIPVSLISIFYILVIIRLRRVSAAKKSKDNKRCHGRVTRLIFSVVAVYVTCWLPYWCFQVYHTFHLPGDPSSMILLINGFTILAYINSMLNPFLYAFLSENFRQSFIKVFKCGIYNKTHSVCNEKSGDRCTGQTFMRTSSSAVVEERMELTALDNISVASCEPADGERVKFQIQQDEHGFLKPPVNLPSTISYRKFD